jgi:hypothetical protein
MGSVHEKPKNSVRADERGNPVFRRHPRKMAENSRLKFMNGIMGRTIRPKYMPNPHRSRIQKVTMGRDQKHIRFLAGKVPGQKRHCKFCKFNPSEIMFLTTLFIQILKTSEPILKYCDLFRTGIEPNRHF